MRGTKVLLYVGGCGLAAVLVFHLLLGIVSYVLIHASRHTPYNIGGAGDPSFCCGNPLPYKNISFLSPHGTIPEKKIKIVGWFFPYLQDQPQCGAYKHLCNIYNTSNNNATIVVVHGHGANMGFVDPNGKGIIQKAVLPFLMSGFNVLTIDLRNHGNSEDALPITLGKFEYLDVLAAVDWLHEQTKGELSYLDPNRIGLYGESMGAFIVLVTASKDNHSYINAIVCESSFTNVTDVFKSWLPTQAGGFLEIFGYDILKSETFLQYMWNSIILLFPFEWKDVPVGDVLSTVHCPIFISHGHADKMIPFSHSGEIIREAKNRKQLCGKKRDTTCIVSSAFYGGGHVQSYDDPEVVLDMINFMEEYV